MAETKISTLSAHTVNPIQGKILPPPTPDALGAHRQALLQTLRDFQAGAIEEAEVKRRTVASREFIGRAKAWIEADGAQYVALRELRRTLKAVEQLAAPTSSTTTTARKKLTEAAVARIKPPATGRMQIPDGHLSGLWLRITDRDVRSWSVLYRVNGGPVRRLTLGKWPAVGVADARELAREALRMAAKGQDPAAVKRAERDEPSDRFDLVAAEFVTRHCKIYQRRWTETEQLIAKYLLPPWRARRLGQIAKPDVLRVVDAISDAGHHRQANKVLALIRQIFKWAIGRGLVERDPAAGIERPHPERSRDRVL